MKNIGIIDPIRLRNLPKAHQSKHEFCFHLHDLMAGLLVEAETSESANVSLTGVNEQELEELHNGTHVLDFLATSGRGDIEKRVVVNHVCITLFADLLHFIYEALIALEKRKFAVAFSLFRKPLKESLLLAAWLCGDEDDFFNKLKSSPNSFEHKKTSPEEKIALIQKAIEVCDEMNFADAKYIYSVVYDRTNKSGLAALFDKATHLVTTNRHIATEEYNLNFIFKNPLDNDIYESIYADLAMLLLFLHIVQTNLYSRMQAANNGYVRWLLFTSIGAYESLFAAGKSRMAATANQLFGDFLNCPRCKQRIKLKKRDAARFFISEMLDCPTCSTTDKFPLSWLLAKINHDNA